MREEPSEMGSSDFVVDSALYIALRLKGKKGILYLGVTHPESGPICKCIYFCVYNYDYFVLIIYHS